MLGDEKLPETLGIFEETEEQAGGWSDNFDNRQQGGGILKADAYRPWQSDKLVIHQGFGK